MVDRATHALIEHMASEAATKAVRETLTTLGIDPEDPLKAQKDMVALREVRDLLDDDEFQKDMIHLRRWRKTMDAVETKGLLVMVTLIISGVAAAFWIGFKDVLGK